STSADAAGDSNTAQAEQPVDDVMSDAAVAPPDETALPEGSQRASEPSASDKDREKDQAKSSSRRPRSLVPPVVPEHNLRLVINILAAHECSARTFRDTLSTMNNLSAIPGAK